MRSPLRLFSDAGDDWREPSAEIIPSFSRAANGDVLISGKNGFVIRLPDNGRDPIEPDTEHDLERNGDDAEG